MAIYRVSIQKTADARYWTNRYFVQAATIQDAQDIGDLIVAAEKTIHLNYVIFASMLTSSIIEGDSAFLVKPLSGVGARTATGPMPLTVCARVLLQPDNFGKPDVKYLRGCIGPGDLGTATLLGGPFVNTINSGYCAAILAIEDVCTDNGQSYATVGVSPKVSQHQLTRGTRKAVTPVIPLG